MANNIGMIIEDATEAYLPATMRMKFREISEKDFRIITSFLKRGISENGWNVGFDEREQTITIPCSPAEVFFKISDSLIQDLRQHSISGLPDLGELETSMRNTKYEISDSQDRIEIHRDPRSQHFKITYEIKSGHSYGVEDGWKRISKKVFGKELSTTYLDLEEPGILDKVHKFFQKIKEENVFGKELTESIDPDKAVKTVKQIQSQHKLWAEQGKLVSLFETQFID